uniref:EF-hand domain-containing protein n=1 Tax=Mucochytrium quahogii TaxID=96639 RepID=A0A7S2S1T6_9STRA|mmetsp:Transcript_18080/g.29321  ORF Transcript_18080/g.29321 Transcript_18080/m.29321 type:complete len:195 (-) Transcript_18080:1693-2277(-)|eukprot:CAMPEP_0203750842 /NCGR_PEP_ID=MMETSP0098-20131031/5009_1 /ASSEMBLY_ACC=CAM_ASM_000208 /TAXON_ID=96639 /ORGANISM=" , Strain NY0313808BC1" /LENGTH=194 /DNA_ID=CAMNT_0050640309 /DNA_START=24 /DNA_END=608 /DNA_ORIENTATION=+
MSRYGSTSAADAYRTAKSGLGSPRRRQKKGKQVLDEEQMEELKEAFNLFDTDSSGTIDVRELKAAMRALGFIVKKAEIREMLENHGHKLEETGGVIEYKEFCDMMTEKMNGRDTREEIMKVFALFDEEGTGKITFRNLKRVAQELGEDLTDDELQEMIDEADRTGEGVIQKDDFYRVMKKRGNDPLDDLSSDED